MSTHTNTTKPVTYFERMPALGPLNVGSLSPMLMTVVIDNQHYVQKMWLPESVALTLLDANSTPHQDIRQAVAALISILLTEGCDATANRNASIRDTELFNVRFCYRSITPTGVPSIIAKCFSMYLSSAAPETEEVLLEFMRMLYVLHYLEAHTTTLVIRVPQNNSELVGIVNRLGLELIKPARQHLGALDASTYAITSKGLFDKFYATTSSIKQEL